MALSEKSDGEISEMLTEYDIKHGPIVVSTRKLYEKKLEKAMEDIPVNTSSDKTYYREEEEEVTYITYSPGRHEAYGVTLRRTGNVEQDEDEDEEEEEEGEGSDEDTEPPIKGTKSAANHSAAAVKTKKPVRKSGGSLWKAIQLLLLLAVLAVVLYYAYCLTNKESDVDVTTKEAEPVGVE
ncbi:emerin (Emery-Dreifuss muscular dystrophy) [Symphorus nematophorus]